jgi:hypothetical protein
MMKKPTHGDKRKRVGKESHVREKIWFNESENPRKTNWLSKRIAVVIFIYQWNRRRNYYRSTAVRKSIVSKYECPNSELFNMLESSYNIDLKRWTNKSKFL